MCKRVNSPRVKILYDLGFAGYISHEFRPAPGHDPLDCIREAYAIIDVSFRCGAGL